MAPAEGRISERQNGGDDATAEVAGQEESQAAVIDTSLEIRSELAPLPSRDSADSATRSAAEESDKAATACVAVNTPVRGRLRLSESCPVSAPETMKAAACRVMVRRLEKKAENAAARIANSTRQTGCAASAWQVIHRTRIQVGKELAAFFNKKRLELLQKKRQIALLDEATQDPRERLHQILAEETVDCATVHCMVHSYNPKLLSSGEHLPSSSSTSDLEPAERPCCEETAATAGARQLHPPDVHEDQASLPQHATPSTRGGSTQRGPAPQIQSMTLRSLKKLGELYLSSETGRPLSAAAAEADKPRSAQAGTRETLFARIVYPAKNGEATQKGGGSCKQASKTTSDSAQADPSPGGIVTLCADPPRPCSMLTWSSSVSVSLPSSRPLNKFSIESPEPGHSCLSSELGGDRLSVDVGRVQGSASRHLAAAAPPPYPALGPCQSTPSSQVSLLQTKAPHPTCGLSSAVPRQTEVAHDAVTKSRKSFHVSEAHAQSPATVVPGAFSKSCPFTAESLSLRDGHLGQHPELLQQDRGGEGTADEAPPGLDAPHPRLAPTVTVPSFGALEGEQQPSKAPGQPRTLNCLSHSPALSSPPASATVCKGKESAKEDSLRETLMKDGLPRAGDAEGETEPGAASLALGYPDSEQESKSAAFDTSALKDPAAALSKESSCAEAKCCESSAETKNQETVGPPDRRFESWDGRLDQFFPASRAAQTVFSEVDAALAEANEALRDAAAAASTILCDPVSSATLRILSSPNGQQTHLLQGQRDRRQHEKTCRQSLGQGPSRYPCESGQSGIYEDWQRNAGNDAFFPCASLLYPVPPKATTVGRDAEPAPEKADSPPNCPDARTTEESLPSRYCGRSHCIPVESVNGVMSLGLDCPTLLETPSKNHGFAAAELLSCRTAEPTSKFDHAKCPASLTHFDSHSFCQCGGVAGQTAAPVNKSDNLSGTSRCLRKETAGQEETPPVTRLVTLRTAKLKRGADAESSPLKTRNRGECLIAAMEETLFCVRALARVGGASGCEDNAASCFQKATRLSLHGGVDSDARHVFSRSAKQEALGVPQPTASNLEVSHEVPTMEGHEPACLTAGHPVESLLTERGRRSCQGLTQLSQTLTGEKRAFPLALLSAAALSGTSIRARPETELLARDRACNRPGICELSDSQISSPHGAGNLTEEAPGADCADGESYHLPGVLLSGAPILGRSSSFGASRSGHLPAACLHPVSRVESRAQGLLNRGYVVQAQAAVQVSREYGPTGKNHVTASPTRRLSKEPGAEQHSPSSLGACQDPRTPVEKSFDPSPAPFPIGQSLLLEKGDSQALFSCIGGTATSCPLNTQTENSMETVTAQPGTAQGNTEDVRIPSTVTLCGPHCQRQAQMCCPPQPSVTENASTHAQSSPLSGLSGAGISPVSAEPTTQSQVTGGPTRPRNQTTLGPKGTSFRHTHPTTAEVGTAQNPHAPSSLLGSSPRSGGPGPAGLEGKQKPRLHQHEATCCLDAFEGEALDLINRISLCDSNVDQAEQNLASRLPEPRDTLLETDGVVFDGRSRNTLSKGPSSLAPSSTSHSKLCHPWSTEKLIAAASGGLHFHYRPGVTRAIGRVEPESLRPSAFACRGGRLPPVARIPGQRQLWSHTVTATEGNLSSLPAGTSPLHQRKQIGAVQERPVTSLFWTPEPDNKPSDGQARKNAFPSSGVCQSRQKQQGQPLHYRATPLGSPGCPGRGGNMARGPDHERKPNLGFRERNTKCGHPLVVQSQRRAQERRQRLEQIKLR
ncbi:hypothetical protein CSUI_006886 [Cystoisospora suis]|uniref:Uncharacterized protein n=1 Tax=Cystoisospora suis TaxID=483139 RepID=A0A2C6KSH6_9APIC|nr:hypothetical protein CSUI_006886 [Cystoisospora suis]